jgi:hypothetical protein
LFHNKVYTERLVKLFLFTVNQTEEAKLLHLPGGYETGPEICYVIIDGD